jgi:hypothetical protein
VPQTQRATDANSSPPPVVQAQLSNSNGCGGESPTLYVQLPVIRYKLMMTQLTFQPVLRVETWKDTVYMAIWWCPQTPPLAILQPDHWHTTLMRAGMSRMSARVFVHAHGLRMQQTLAALMHILLAPATIGGNIRVWLAPPPWRRSYTFGVPREVAHVIEPLQTAARAIMLAYDYGVSFSDESEHHISWR